MNIKLAMSVAANLSHKYGVPMHVKHRSRLDYYVSPDGDTGQVLLSYGIRPPLTWVRETSGGAAGGSRINVVTLWGLS